MNCFLRQLIIKDFEKLGGRCGEFLLLSHRVQTNADVLVRDRRDRNAPEGESVCSDVIEFGGILKLDGFLELADSLGRLDIDSERGLFAIDETEQAQGFVGQGVSKHRWKAMREDGEGRRE